MKGCSHCPDMGQDRSPGRRSTGSSFLQENPPSKVVTKLQRIASLHDCQNDHLRWRILGRRTHIPDILLDKRFFQGRTRGVHRLLDLMQQMLFRGPVRGALLRKERGGGAPAAAMQAVIPVGPVVHRDISIRVIGAPAVVHSAGLGGGHFQGHAVQP